MSNYLSVAVVTAALQRTLSSVLTRVFPGAQVTVMPPDRLNETMGDVGANVFLFQSTPNPAFRNNDQPMRSSDGTLLRRPQLGLDLHYLITYFGKSERYEPEQVMALVSMELHTNAVLLGDRLRAAASSLPSGLLAKGDLDVQREPVTITQRQLSIEDMHRFWTIFQSTPYRLSTIYVASVVLLDGPIPGVPLSVQAVNSVAQPSPGDTIPPATPELQPTMGVDPIFALRTNALTSNEVPVVVLTPSPFPLPGNDARLLLNGTVADANDSLPVLGSNQWLTTPVDFPFAQIPQSATVPAALRSAVVRAGVQLPPRTEFRRVAGSSSVYLNDKDSLASYSLRAMADGTCLMAYGLLTSDPPDSVVAAIPGVLPGDYLVRYQVADVATPLVRTGDAFTGPIVSVR